MANKYLTVKDPTTEKLFQEIYNKIDLGAVANGQKAGNLDAHYVVVGDTGNADTEFSATHKLERVPQGYIVVYADTAGVVYDSGTAWTTSTIYLKCDAANAGIKLLIW
jgi:hypothetical protein